MAARARPASERGSGQRRVIMVVSVVLVGLLAGFAALIHRNEAATRRALSYDSASGGRVFSGAFSPAATALGAYLKSVVPITGGSAYRADRSGHVLAASSGANRTGQNFARLALGVSELDISTGSTTFAV